MIDTHCHIDLFSNPHEVAKKAENGNIRTIAVTNLPSHFKMGYPHLKDYKKVRLALGLHPLMAGSHHKSELRLFKELVDKTSYIGEIGLDFSKQHLKNKQVQINSFNFVLENIKNRPRFITIHSRKAERAVLDILKEHETSPVVFHWYTGPLSLIEHILNEGHYFSINTAMINSKSGLKIVKRIPPTRILTETDGPFIKVNSLPAEPYNVSLVVEYLSTIWGISKLQTEDKINQNFRRILAPLFAM